MPNGRWSRVTDPWKKVMSDNVELIHLLSCMLYKFFTVGDNILIPLKGVRFYIVIKYN